MSYEEEFDRIMREKAGELDDHPFNESHWEMASKMIRDSRRTRKAWPVKTILWTGSVIVGVSLGALVIGLDHSAELSLADNRDQHAIILDQKPHTEAQETAYSVTPPDNAENVTSVVSAVHPAPAVENGNTAPKQVSAVTGGEKPGRDTYNDVSAEVDALPHKNASAMSAARVPVTEKNMIKPVAADRKKDVPAGTKEYGNQEAQSGEIVATESEEQTLSYLFLGRKRMALEYQPREQVMFLAPLSEQGLFEEDYYNSRHRTRVFYLDLMAGASFLAGWHAPEGYDGRGAAWYGGINAGLFIGKRFSLGSGIQAFNLGHLDQPFYSATGIDYDFSSVTSQTVITNKQLQYFAVPLTLNYHFAGGDRIGLGILGAQLWRADNEVLTEKFQDNSVISRETVKNNNLYEGMNQQLFMLSASYNLQLGNRISAGAELIFGLNDMFTKETYLKGQQKPALLRVGLTYALLEK